MQNTALKTASSPFTVPLMALYVIALLSGISVGLFNPFISTFMAQNNVDDIWIGANSTIYFLMIALSTSTVAAALERIGLRRTMIFGLTLMGITAPLFPLTTQLPLWFVIRAVMGLACCFYLVAGQAALNAFCAESNRAVVSGLHAMSFSLGFGLGPLIGSLFYGESPRLVFLVGGVLMLSGIGIVNLGLPAKSIQFQPVTRGGLYKKIGLPLQGAFAYGFTVATLVSLYPVYMLQQGYGVSQISQVISIFVVGGLIATIPITRLASRFGTLKILGGCGCFFLVAMASQMVLQDLSMLRVANLVAGASLSPIFPLALALVGSALPREQLPAGSALFTAMYTAGCTAGPILSATVNRTLGNQYFFAPILILFMIFMLKVLRVQKLTPPTQA